jgi:hypothetical protein
MSRKFKTANYEATLDLTITLREALPPDHLARFIVDVVAQLDFSKFYARYAATGAPPYAPELLFSLERYQQELEEYQAKLREREEKARKSGRKPGGRPPQPPVTGPRDKDQYNFTDPESQAMKNSKDGGFDQHLQ